MGKIPIGISPQEERIIDDYVNKVSEDYFGKSYNPSIKPKQGVLPEGVGGSTSSSCSVYGCKPESITLNEAEQAFYQYKRLVPIFHEKTHEAHMKALPYLPMAVDESFIEGLTIYTNIKELLKKGETGFANVYYNSLSKEYKQYYHKIKDLERSGVSIKEWAKKANERGMEKVLGKEYLVPKEIKKYN